MFTFEISGGGYRLFKDGTLCVDQAGDPRLPCSEPTVLTPFADDAAAEAHARAAIVAMSPPAAAAADAAPAA